MVFRQFVMLITLAWAATAFGAPSMVNPLFSGKVVRTFMDETANSPSNPIPPGSFPVQVIEESKDGTLYRVHAANGPVCVPKMDVKADKSGIDASAMCVTVVARAETGATRNANEGCRSRK